MQHSFFQQAGLKALAFTALFVTLFSLNAKAGLDSYSIYLNNKLVLKQAVNQPLDVNGLHLTQANANDQLVVYYSDCHAPNKIGKGRRIVVQNDKGETIKEWKFADVSGTDKGMTIPVKEILALKKKAGGNLSLVYAASQKNGVQKLTGLQLG